MTTKTTGKVKKVKAWAIQWEEKEFWLYPTKELAEKGTVNKAFPCTITYTLPTTSKTLKAGLNNK